MVDILTQLWGGFQIAFQPINLMVIIFGCTVGLFIGAIPGLGSVNGVAILLPLLKPIFKLVKQSMAKA